MYDSTKEVTLKRSINSPFTLYSGHKGFPSSHKVRSGSMLVKNFTLLYRQLLTTLDPLRPQIKVPRRILTFPHEGVQNEGLDNVEHELILRVEDQIINEKKKQYHNKLVSVYIIDDLLGKGNFGQVAKCHREGTKDFYAIKIIKNQPAYNQQCITEIQVLKQLQQVQTSTIINLQDQFVFKQHICLVFPMMSYTLFDLLKLNNYSGINVHLVRKFLKFILQGLVRAEECGVVHADLKPENIMLLEDKNGIENSLLKIIDFGSSCFLSRRPPYIYIQSRFYRAPEIILRIPKYTSKIFIQTQAKIDMWSLGCIAAELISGYALFPGLDEYACFWRIVQVTQQKLDPGYILQSPEWKKYFNRSLEGSLIVKNRMEFEDDNGLQVKEPFPIAHPIQSLHDLKDSYNNLGAISEPNFEVYLDFVQNLLALNPEERMSASEAIDHPFILNKQKTSYEGLLYKNLNLFQISCRIWRMTQKSISPNSYHQTKMKMFQHKRAWKLDFTSSSLSNRNGTNEMISIKQTNEKARQIIQHKNVVIVQNKHLFKLLNGVTAQLQSILFRLDFNLYCSSQCSFQSCQS